MHDRPLTKESPDFACERVGGDKVYVEAEWDVIEDSGVGPPRLVSSMLVRLRCSHSAVCGADRMATRTLEHFCPFLAKHKPILEE